ncbi:hypothetical protein BRADO4951 [Bradyrhizobium sp. ORS 278]|uniref:hypothetical protein n=1 Tax=Bradyrhizobium sp. (strain ORS 278) TaxID=114615 RepID=UPI0001508CB5|nr:hypothetical protein [Bradyrhizobium sp. ORS 278]CAL78653.1 hypothetical protein BRADO4951 [Bradyrhizobium sp. ORS 278]
MSISDDEIFDRWLNKVGEYGGIVPARIASKLMAGGRLVMKYLPIERCTETIVQRIPAQRALELGTAALSKLGKLVPDDDIEHSGRVLRAVVGAGIFNMNPAIVRVEIVGRDPGECEFRISGVAKEGFIIKQDTAPKAVERVASELRKLIGLYQ